MIYLFTFIVCFILFLIDREKTIKGVKRGLKKLKKNTPVFLNLIILISFSLSLISDDLIVKYLGEGNELSGMILAAVLGSVTFMPGFIAFPLAGVLLEKQVNYTTIAAFTTTLMMVGFITFPLEKSYFGTKLTIIRNIASFIIAIIVAILIGIFYGELFI